MTQANSPDGASLLVEAVILCDQVRFENNGKAFLIGVYNDIVQVPKLPFALNVTLAIQTRIIKAGDVEFAISVSDPLGNNLTEGLRGQGKYEGECGHLAWLPVVLPPLQLIAEGEYSIGIQIADVPDRREAFQVRRNAPVPVQVSQTRPN